MCWSWNGNSASAIASWNKGNPLPTLRKSNPAERMRSGAFRKRLPREKHGSLSPSGTRTRLNNSVHAGMRNASNGTRRREPTSNRCARGWPKPNRRWMPRKPRPPGRTMARQGMPSSRIRRGRLPRRGRGSTSPSRTGTRSSNSARAGMRNASSGTRRRAPTLNRCARGWPKPNRRGIVAGRNRTGAGCPGSLSRPAGRWRGKGCR